MKINLSRLLRVSGALCTAFLLWGCVASAQQNAPPPTNEVSQSAVTNAPAELDAPADADNGTNEVAQPLNIVAAIPPSPPPNVNLSTAVREVIKLSQSDVSEAVIILYVEKSNEAFDLDAAEIVYLKDIGISPDVMAAMLTHDGATADIQHDFTPTNQTAVAEAPITNQPPAGAPQMEVSSNYVATTPAQQIPTVIGDPNAVAGVVQQPVIIEQQPSVVYTSPAVSQSYFYSSLSPYGTWMDVPDYGWCWQPSIAVSYQGWRPYMHGGRWLYSTSGWYWQSDYSWGWAPFHYGRWFCAPRRGWVWVPDYTWGPSWVTWRRGADYCGWAPLPPRSRFHAGVGFTYFGRNVGVNFSFGLSEDHFCFVPTRHFIDRRLTDHVVPTVRARNIYNNTTVVNNYIVGNNNTIINNGVGRDYVASHTRTEIRQIAIKDAPATPGRRIQADRIDRSHNQAVVYRPQPPSKELVQRHESVVRAESSRRELASTAPAGALIRPIRPAVSGRSTATVTPQTSRPAGNTPRRETSRSSIASTATELPTWSKPAPVRVRQETPITARTAPQVPSRTIRPVTPATPRGSFARPEANAPAPRTPQTTVPSISGQRIPSRSAIVTSPRGASQLSSRAISPSQGTATRQIQPAQPAPRSPVVTPSIPRRVTPQPAARQPAITPSPSPRQQSITPTPRQPTIAPAPRQPSVSPAPRQPSVGPAPRQPNNNPAPQRRQESSTRTPQRSRSQSFNQRGSGPITVNPAASSRSAYSSPRVATGRISIQSTPQRIVSPAPRVIASPRQESISGRQYTAPVRQYTAPRAAQISPRSYTIRSAPPVATQARRAPAVQVPRRVVQSPRASSQSVARPIVRSAPPARTASTASSNRGSRGRIEIGR
jgi:hypothetical protein